MALRLLNEIFAANMVRRNGNDVAVAIAECIGNLVNHTRKLTLWLESIIDGNGIEDIPKTPWITNQADTPISNIDTSHFKTFHGISMKGNFGISAKILFIKT